jgi:hypothetical protein
VEDAVAGETRSRATFLESSVALSGSPSSRD